MLIICLTHLKTQLPKDNQQHKTLKIQQQMNSQLKYHSQLIPAFKTALQGIRIHCEFCGEYLCAANETQCGHCFCEQCINFYLLFLDSCPICGFPLRNTIIYKNIPLDNIIEDYVQAKDPGNLAAFKQRRQALQELKNSRRIKRVRLGMHVDIRDADFIWCEGVVCKVIKRKNDRLVMVRYRFSKKSELLNIEGQRIAKLGSYTNHKEIPHYSKGKVVIEEWQGLQIQLQTSTSLKEQKMA